MKISTYIGFLLVIGAVLFLFTSMVLETGDNYPDSDINSSGWADKYDYAQDVNETIAPLQRTFALIEDENTGWFTKIAAGIAAVPLAVIRIPFILFESFTIGGKLITGVLTTFSLPAYLIMVVLIMIVVWGIFKLVEVFQRWPV